ncbi:MAG: hypothetical protein ABI595_06355 [Actinomycetota bacterium]
MTNFTEPSTPSASAAIRVPGNLERDIDTGGVRIGPNGDPYTVTSWAAIDMDAVRHGKARPGTEFLPRTDGEFLIYSGLPHTFYGESESLKSWGALLACRSFLEQGFTALYVDFEGDEWTLYERALHVGIPDAAIGRALRYARPTEHLKGNPNAHADLMMEEADLRPSLVVLDGVSEAYSLHGWDINKATDAAEFQKLFGNFAEGTATISIDHTGKDASRGVVGSQHKRAGLNGAEYLFTPVRREGRGGHSTASIKVTKDRMGYVRGYAPKGTVGILHVADEVDRRDVWIEAPSYIETLGGDSGLAAAILELVTVRPGLSTTAIEQAKPGGGVTAIRSELLTLEADGKVRHETGARNAKHWYPVETPSDVIAGVVDRYRERGQVVEPV